MAVLQILIAHSSLRQSERISAWLAGEGWRTRILKNHQAAVEEALFGDYAAVLISCENEEDASRIRMLHQAGYLRPIITLGPASCAPGEICLSLPGDSGREELLELLYARFQGSAVEAEAEAETAFRNSSIFTQLRHSFLRGLADSLLEIEKAFAAGDWESVKHLAHALKGTAASFGFTQLAESSKEIELLLRAQNNRAAQAELDKLRGELRRHTDLLVT